MVLIFATSKDVNAEHEVTSKNPVEDSTGALMLSRLSQLCTVTFPAVVVSGAETVRRFGQFTTTSDPTDTMPLNVMVSIVGLPYTYTFASSDPVLVGVHSCCPASPCVFTRSVAMSSIPVHKRY